MSDTTAETTVPKITRTKYIVHKANIMDENGNKVLHGEVVELGTKLAARYNKLGFLRPFIEPDDAYDGDEDAVPVPTKSRRMK